MAVSFPNVATQHYNYMHIGAAVDASVVKPSVTTDGWLSLVTIAFNAQTAGSPIITNLGDENIIGSQNSATLFQTGFVWRLGLAGDPATIECNNSAGDAVQKTGAAIIVSGHNPSSPIRGFTLAGGNSATPSSGDVSAPAPQSGDLICRILTWHDDGDALNITHPGSHSDIAGDYKPAAANGKGFAMSFVNSSGGATGSAAWAILNGVTPTARDYVTATIVIASAGDAVQLMGAACY